MKIGKKAMYKNPIFVFAALKGLSQKSKREVSKNESEMRVNERVKWEKEWEWMSEMRVNKRMNEWNESESKEVGKRARMKKERVPWHVLALSGIVKFDVGTSHGDHDGTIKEISNFNERSVRQNNQNTTKNSIYHNCHHICL